jgi:AraC-like DNA-binding protein
MTLPDNHFLCLQDKQIAAHQFATCLVDLAVSRGVNKDKLLRGTGIFVDDLQYNKKLSASQLLQLVTNAQAFTPGYDCAFQLGRRLFSGNDSVLSNTILHSRNLAQALKLMMLLGSQICPFFDCTSYQAADRQYLIINQAIGCHEQSQFLIEAYCSALISAVKLLCGQRIPMYFSFPFSRPKYIQEYEENLGFRVNFSQSLFTISFEKKLLSMACLQRSDSLKWYTLKQAKTSSMPKRGFLAEVRHIINQNDSPSLQCVATHFAMSPSTFKRKLKLHNASFQQLQDLLGKQQAIYLLQIKQLTNEQSAQLLQFNDIPNFRRSVKRWTGLTPNELRLTE